MVSRSSPFCGRTCGLAVNDITSHTRLERLHSPGTGARPNSLSHNINSLLLSTAQQHHSYAVSCPQPTHPEQDQREKIKCLPLLGLSICVCGCVCPCFCSRIDHQWPQSGCGTSPKPCRGCCSFCRPQVWMVRGDSKKPKAPLWPLASSK